MAGIYFAGCSSRHFNACVRSSVVYIMKLEVSFDEHGINYRFFPFHLKIYSITWAEIDAMYIRRYRQLMEYGGWGIRFGLFGAGTAYNICGNIGLQVNAGKRKILFGTQEQKVVDAALKLLLQDGILHAAQLTDDGVVLIQKGSDFVHS